MAAWVAPAIGAVAGLMGSKKGGGSTQTTNEPWSAQQPYLKDLFSQAQTLYGSGDLSRTLGFDPLELAGQQGVLNAAQTQLPQVGSQALQTYGQLLNAPNVANSPLLQQYIQSALRPLEQSLTQNVLPGIRGEAGATGNVGGSRQGIAEGLAMQEFTRQGADVSTRIMQDAYQRGLQTALQAMSQGQNVTGLTLAPSLLTQGVGAETRSLQQMQANDPYSALQRYQGLISGNFGSTVNAPAPQGNPVMGALGGAMAANSLQNLWSQSPTTQAPQTSWTDAQNNWFANSAGRD